METNTASMPTGIRPIERPQGPQTSGVQRRGGVTTSPFAPRTDVSLQNSVADVAGLLSKISSAKEEAMDQISPQLQKLVDNIMKQSFSLESTLAEGLGTTLENQRFAIDQLFTLARMLHQMGTLSEQGTPAALNDELQTILSNFKELMTDGEGKDMEPTMLHKLAFEVLDGKQAETLPAMMQFLLSQQGASMLAAQPESDSLGFLKQLMDYFMPRPSGGTEAARGEQEPAQETAGQEAADGSAEPGTTAEAKGGAETQNTAFARQAPARNTAQGSAAPQQAAANEAGDPASMKPQGEVRDGAEPRQPQQNAAPPNGTESVQQAQQPQQAQNAQQAQQPQQAVPQQAQQEAQPTAQNTSPQGQGETAAARETEKTPTAASLWESLAVEEEQQGTSQTAEPNPQDPFAELMRKGLERMNGRLQQQAMQAQQGEPEAAASPFAGRVFSQTPMQNTPRTMEAMKQLASLLLKETELTPEDERLLTDFVNNRQTMLSEKDAKELQMLLRLCEKNVPASVLQSAQQKGMEDMPRLWAFMELCDLAMIKERDPKALKRAGKSLSDFASMMKNSMLPENGRTAEGQRSMSFMTPLYMADDMQKPYPAYIHVYDENQKDENGGPAKKETWIRVCLLTDNIGAVDVSFRMYEDSNLDVRIYFSEKENLEEFRDYMDEFRASFDDKPLTLMSVKVGVAGAKT